MAIYDTRVALHLFSLYLPRPVDARPAVASRSQPPLAGLRRRVVDVAGHGRAMQTGHVIRVVGAVQMWQYALPAHEVHVLNSFFELKWSTKIPEERY